jgi:hypothetical protein
VGGAIKGFLVSPSATAFLGLVDKTFRGLVGDEGSLDAIGAVSNAGSALSCTAGGRETDTWSDSATSTLLLLACSEPWPQCDAREMRMMLRRTVDVIATIHAILAALRSRAAIPRGKVLAEEKEFISVSSPPRGAAASRSAPIAGARRTVLAAGAGGFRG